MTVLINPITHFLIHTYTPPSIHLLLSPQHLPLLLQAHWAAHHYRPLRDGGGTAGLAERGGGETAPGPGVRPL